MTPGVRLLLRKEIAQLGRNRTAVITATFLPIMLLILVPLPQLLGGRDEPLRDLPFDELMPPGLSGIGSAADLLLQLVFPLLVTLTGLILPSLGAVHAIVTERERRTLELLVALPFRVGEILVAKLLAVLVLSAGIVLPLFAIDAALLLLFDLADVVYVALLALTLAAALVCSSCLSLLLAILARDFRSANNINGVLFVPLLFMSLGVLATVPGPARLAVLSVVLVLAGAAALFVSLRVLTFERYLE